MDADGRHLHLITTRSAAKPKSIDWGSDVGAGAAPSRAATSPPTTTNDEQLTAATATGLVGRWRTQNVCPAEVRALRRAGLGEFVREWIAGEYPSVPAKKVAPGADPCRGARPMRHDHSFGEDGAFASYDQNGAQVDDGSYTPVDDHKFTLPDPPIRVRYRFDGHTATFTPLLPHCTTRRYRKNSAYVVSVFFPRTYQRVK